MREGSRAERAVMDRKGAVTIKKTGYKFAELSERDLLKLHDLENELDMTLIAYKRAKA